MRIRNCLGLAVAVPGLVVALAAPGDAASTSVVAFAGRIEVQPTALGELKQLDICFFTLQAECGNGAESTGMAAGVADVEAVDAVDGLRATATYRETCTPGTGVAPVGEAELSGSVHRATTGWSPDVSAQWVRAGLVAVISGDDVAGAALFTPLEAATDPAACGRAVPVQVVGAVELAY